MIRLCVFLLLLPLAPFANERFPGGIGIFTNDYLGDGHDRWRTFSAMRSEMMATRFGLVELRARTEMIAPRHIGRPHEAGERAYVGLIAPGAFLHGTTQDTAWRLGGELVVSGPQSGVAHLMERAHAVLGFQEPIATEDQTGNGFYPTLMAEAEWPFAAGHVRPFVAAEAGAESLMRAGVDLLLGPAPNDSLFIREPVTGHRVAILRGEIPTRPTITLGADVARIFESHWLEDDITDPWRLRLRAGIDGRIFGQDVFAGVTWLSPEYDAQDSGQITGSIAALFRF